MNVDYQSLFNQDNLATNALRNALRNSSRSSSTLNANLQTAYANQAERKADISLKEQMAQNDLDKYRNNLDMQIGMQNVQAREAARLETAANKSTKNNLVTQGLGDLAQAAVWSGQGMNAGLFNRRSYEALQAMYPNFTLADYQEYLNSGKSFSEFIKYRK